MQLADLGTDVIKNPAAKALGQRCRKYRECSSLDCGRHPMNPWFRRHAWRSQEARLTRTNVLRDPVTGRIVGYVSMCAAQLKRAYMPKADQRNRPESIPAMLLAQFGNAETIGADGRT